MITTDLPIEPLLPELLRTLDEGASAVLVAPPGAGKTTRVPLALLAEARFRGDGRILVLEPRRLAARAAAMRMAALLGEPVGQRIGFRTRVEGAGSEATRVEAITEGLLVARLLDDPTLEDVAAVLFDEIHERSVDADLALALCLDLQRSRPELRLLAMSATPDTARLVRLLGDCPLLESAGRAHPVEIRHAARDLAHPREVADAVARAAASALREAEGDVLCFLPGKAEIARATRALEAAGPPARVLPLHGDMPPDAQAAVLRPGEGGRRIVLATSIAETSLTVPGVRIVVDGGFRRAPRFDAASGLPRLATLPVSRAAADQRAGRAGREAPGLCLRLWTAAAQRARPPFDRPEILETDLAPLRLALAAWEADWGTPHAALAWIDPPPAGAFEAAGALLRGLGALDEAGAITPLGRAMARLGTHPRLAAVLLAARDPGEAALAALLAALLEERDPLGGRGAPPASADLALRIDAVLGGDAAGADRGAIARIREGARGFRRRLRLPGDAVPAGDPGALLAAGFPDRIAQARGEPGAFRLSGGGSASLAATDPLARSRLLVAAGLHLGRSARITLASPLDADALPGSLLARATTQVERGLDPASGAVFARSRVRLGALVLSDRLLAADPDEAARALAGAAASSIATALPWTEAARNLQARVSIARRLLDPALPDLSDAALAAASDRTLLPAIRAGGFTKLADLARLDMRRLLANLLGADALRRLDRDLPEALALPRGRATVDYTADPPVAAARAQIFYGLDATPVLAGGRVPLAIALLSPAGRPIALTRDLRGFWRGGWADARRDMRGRYPRHDWPEQPWTAPLPARPLRP